jgi:ubiquinone/menaquinone biosynthesis C-methylase UbiE
MNWTGLAARAWDPSGGDEPQLDYDFIKDALEHNPGPALDIGCGTSRLLLRYLRAGLEVEGIDTSADMLAICQEKAGRQGLKPVLYQQAKQNLDLPRKYKTIYIPCGTFVLVIDREESWEALRRFRNHLEPSGVLILNIFWPFDDREPLSEKPLGGLGRWGDLWAHRQPDGSVIAQHLKIEKIDRVEQLLIAKRRYQLIQDGRVMQEEIFDSNERWYYKHEMMLMLEKVGFKNIQVKGDWSGDNFTEGHTSMVFMARKSTK